ncbi:MAG: sigma-54-dependent Fis family transcriptional regulator [Desulfovibrionaceae bacterium]|nr:sigma-54-dependent Fis family transcriptional regulator [Desulfovibrionaceae bacterium]
MAATILIVDDEEGIRLSLRGILEDEGYAVAEAASAEEGLSLAERLHPDMVFLDIWLPGMDGMAALEQFRARSPELPVVMISGHGTIETAVSALRCGAHDFIEKPLSLDKILLLVQHTLEMDALRRENKALRAAMEQGEESVIVGQSPAMLRFREELARVAPTDAWVLITGENGTGKELAARAVHRGSKRAAAPLVAVNCAAIPEELIESELFGHERGAFTGADGPRTGKFELAHKGTLFLDEIGDMSLKTQAKILRILEEQNFERVGGTRTIHVDVRVIAATNKNLEDAIRRGEFRADLYYRLRVFPLCLPPLRERGGDIPLLVAALAARLERRTGMKPPLFAPDALAAMSAWAWPGNVRELAHLVERMTILRAGAVVSAADLPPEMHTRPSPGAAGDAHAFLARLLASDMDFKRARAAFETYYLEAKLAEAGGNITRLAEAVGLERSYVHRKLKAARSAGGQTAHDKR